jgi:hypothetical protein
MSEPFVELPELPVVMVSSICAVIESRPPAAGWIPAFSRRTMAPQLADYM